MSLIQTNIKNMLRMIVMANKLVCVDDKLSKSFMSYLEEHSVYNFLNSMVQESKCCSYAMKKHFSNKNCDD